jgi:hypothetical protein
MSISDEILDVLVKHDISKVIVFDNGEMLLENYDTDKQFYRQTRVFLSDFQTKLTAKYRDLAKKN